MCTLFRNINFTGLQKKKKKNTAFFFPPLVKLVQENPCPKIIAVPYLGWGVTEPVPKVTVLSGHGSHLSQERL